MSNDLYIVTGASRGLGEALCRELLREGHHVIGIARTDNSSLVRFARETEGAIEYHNGDISDIRMIETIVSSIVSTVERVVASSVTLINNASVLSPVGPIETVSSTDLHVHFSTNLIGPATLTGRLLAEVAQESTHVTVLNISSGAARSAYFGRSLYCAAKAGLEVFTRTVALEQAELHSSARLYAVRPGVIDTEMQRYSRELPNDLTHAHEQFAQLKQTGKLVPPEKAAELVLRTRYDDRVGSGDVVDIRDLFPEEV